MNKDFYINNRKKLVDSIKDNALVILHSGFVFQNSGDQDFPFSVNRNFYYLTGIDQDDVILVITKTAGKVNEALFIEENDPVLVKWIGAKLEKDEASDLSGIDNVYYKEQFDNYIFNVINPSRRNYNVIENCYLDLERRKDLAFLPWPFKFSKRFSRDYPEIKIENVYSNIIKLRMYKTKEEIGLIKDSILTTQKALEKVMHNLKEGMFEYQIESYFDQAIKYDGQKPHSFKTICASGKNATILHYTANNSKINKGDLVLFDLGCHTDYYISDISRTYPANGKFSERQKQIYEIVLNCNKECIKFLKPGVSWQEYNNFANSLLIAGLKKIGLIKEDKELEKYYWHSVGHSIGLDTHDPTLANLKFSEGMLTTVEPGLYLEDEGIGVRIEDNVLITKDGCINLSAGIIKEVCDIEKFMAK